VLAPTLSTVEAGLPPLPAENLEVARLLERIAEQLILHKANPFRVRAYQEAALRIRQLRQPLREILRTQGSAGLDEVPAIGPSIASLVSEYLTTGHLRLLARLEGRSAPEDVFVTLPGIGEELARRLHEQLGMETLEELELAAHDGRLQRVPGFGPRRTRALRDLLAARLSRSLQRDALTEHGALPCAAAPALPDVATLLALDAAYRERSAQGELHRIAPLRFNPLGDAWLPVLHTEQDGWHFSALFSNSARAHRRRMTHDWVILHYARDGRDGQCTVVTEWHGPLAGRRVVRGREHECGLDYGPATAIACGANWSAERDSRATVLALRASTGHPGSPGPIETLETRLSWVFLTPSHAYKLKKPARTEHFDYTSLEARRWACEAELQLNRRLAASVVLDVVPVCCDETGRHVEGQGEVVDWLLKMRRLNRDSMLDACIARQAVSDRQLDALALVLSRFYSSAATANLTGPEYRSRLAAHLASQRAILALPRYDQDPALLHSLCTELERWIEQHADQLDARAPRVREAHGDLRPEHICLEAEPVIIDSLAFDRELRLLDPWSELALLDLECRRLGNDWIGPRLSSGYARGAADPRSDELVAFYGRYHAVVRAALAAARIDEPGADLEQWLGRAQTYLQLASGGTARVTAGTRFAQHAPSYSWPREAVPAATR
jgi:aminoglycoside phosphotransferase family enzyme